MTQVDILKPLCTVCFWFGTIAENCCLQCSLAKSGKNFTKEKLQKEKSNVPTT